MIATAVDTNEFAQIVPQDHFSVDAPNTNPLMAASALDVTRTEEGLTFSVAQRVEQADPAIVERTLDEIVERCERNLKLYPKSGRSMLNLALALINAGKVERAVGLLERLLEMEPTNYIALNAIALVFFNQSDFVSATKMYLRTHEAFPNDPSPLINLASIALRQEDYVGASSYLESAYRLDGCSVMAKYLLSMVLLRLGKYNKAVGLLRTAIRDTGQSAELYQGLAIAYYLSADFKRAEKSFLTVLAINGTMGSAVHGLALLYLEQNRLDEVIEVLQGWLKENSGDMQARELLARAYAELGQFSRARGQLTSVMPTAQSTAIEREESARISNNIAVCFAREGKAREAESWLTKSISMNARDVAPFTNLGRALHLQGRNAEALHIIKRADTLGLTSNDSESLKAVLLVELGRAEDAIDLLQNLINTGKAPITAYADLGSLLAEWHEEYDASISVLRKGLEIDPANVFVLNNLAYAHLMRGDVSSARVLLNQVGDESGVNHVVLTATRGLLSLREGDIAKGEEFYKRAEGLAFQSGHRALAISVRHKRFLEMARAYLISGEKEKAIRQVQLGSNIKGGLRFYRIQDQLMALSSQYQLPQGTQELEAL